MRLPYSLTGTRLIIMNPLKNTHLPPLSQLEEEHCAARLITLRAAAVICVRHWDSDGDVLLGFAKSGCKCK